MTEELATCPLTPPFSSPKWEPGEKLHPSTPKEGRVERRHCPTCPCIQRRITGGGDSAPSTCNLFNELFEERGRSIMPGPKASETGRVCPVAGALGSIVQATWLVLLQLSHLLFELRNHPALGHVHRRDRQPKPCCHFLRLLAFDGSLPKSLPGQILKTAANQF